MAMANGPGRANPVAVGAVIAREEAQVLDRGIQQSFCLVLRATLEGQLAKASE